MDDQDLINALKFEYHSIQAANPNWDKSLWDFLVERKVEPDVIWEHCPDAGWDAGKPEPEWL